MPSVSVIDRCAPFESFTTVAVTPRLRPEILAASVVSVSEVETVIDDESVGPDRVNVPEVSWVLPVATEAEVHEDAVIG